MMTLYSTFVPTLYSSKLYGGLLLRRENSTSGELVALYSKSARIDIVVDYWRVKLNIT